MEVEGSFAPQIWWGSKGDIEEGGNRSFVHFLIFVFEIRKTRIMDKS